VPATLRLEMVLFAGYFGDEIMHARWPVSEVFAAIDTYTRLYPGYPEKAEAAFMLDLSRRVRRHA